MRIRRRSAPASPGDKPTRFGIDRRDGRPPYSAPVPAALRIAALTLLTELAAGCFTVGHLAFVTTRNGPSASGSDPRHVRGQSCVPLIVVFPAGPLPNLGDAVEAALRAGEGRVMRNAVVRFELAYIPFVGGRGCYVVEGDVS